MVKHCAIIVIRRQIHMQDRINQSAIKYYKSCCFKYFLKYELGLVVPQKILPLVFGKSFHTAIELYEKGIPLEETFRKEFTADQIQEEERASFEDDIKDGIALLNKYAEKKEYIEKVYNLKAKSSETFFNEYFTNPATGKRSSIPFSGVIDRITITDDLVDFKTSSSKYQKEDVDIAIQATMYSFYQYQKTKKNPIKFTYVVFIKGRKDPQIQIIQTTRSTKDYPVLFEDIENLIKEVQNKRFDPKPSYQCLYCEFKSICPYAKK